MYVKVIICNFYVGKVIICTFYVDKSTVMIAIHFDFYVFESKLKIGYIFKFLKNYLNKVRWTKCAVGS